jgi:hypothetical protein
MHHAWIDRAQCPGWHDQRWRAPRPKALSTCLDNAYGECFMQVRGESEVTILGKQEFRGPECLIGTTP